MLKVVPIPVSPDCCGVLSACAVGPNYHAPETRAAEKFDGVEATTTYFTRKKPSSSSGAPSAIRRSMRWSPKRARPTTTCASR